MKLTHLEHKKVMSSLQFFLSEKALEAGVTLGLPKTGDAGFDLPALEDCQIPPKGSYTIPTGVHLAIPVSWVGLVRDRSSVALKGGAVTAGVIDAGYRGEVKVVMHNLSDSPLLFKKGDRVAQIVVIPHLIGEESEQVKSIEDLGNTSRGSGGFGSTGR
jgi:dUTP pyrophosphatase